MHTGLQAIETKFLGPTNTLGARVKARCAAGTYTHDWDYALNSDANHAMAAARLADQLDWSTHSELVGGTLPHGGSAFVLVPRREVVSA